MNSNWGRNDKPSLADKLGALMMITCAPIFALVFNMANLSYNSSLALLYFDIRNLDLDKLYMALPRFDLQILLWSICWIFFQLVLALLPDYLSRIIKYYRGGICAGNTTPAGKILYYNINGLQAWAITHILFLLLSIYQIVDPAAIARNWGAMFVAANIIGYLVTILAYLKAKYYSSHPDDNKETGCFHYDITMGIEFNPRILDIDIKLFFNGRPGIIGWTLINISFACLQYQKYGYLSNSMVLVNILQGIYVLDFFWNENWYLKTIDIAHDHFGWILSWGDCVFLPFMYTLQAAYLANHPTNLGNLKFIAILIFGISGYVLFRWTNYQKDYFRHNEKPMIWGTYAKYISCSYTIKSTNTNNSNNSNNSHKIYHSKLLVAGFWKWARHMNYTGDLVLSLAYCLACGFNHILPYFYFAYMFLLLVTRCLRDEHRCLNKYGDKWRLYCENVRYRLIPYIF